LLKTKSTIQKASQAFNWWQAGSKRELAEQLLSTINFLKDQQNNRARAAAVHARMYGNMPLMNFAGAS